MPVTRSYIINGTKYFFERPPLDIQRYHAENIANDPYNWRTDPDYDLKRKR